MDKVISYSVWGNNPKYIKGAYKNLLLQKEFFPEWKCRFYVDYFFPREIGIKLLEEGAQVYSSYASDGYYGLYWRFEVLKDLSIERFIVRDVDSRLSLRDAIAVKEWEESKKDFHIIRDNAHHNVPICGGLWGATNKFIQEMSPIYKDLLKKHLTNLTFNEIYHSRGKYFYTDQLFLWRYIWPKIINKHLAHIKDLPQLVFTGNEKIYPNESERFIGEAE